MPDRYFEVQHFTLACGWVNTWSDGRGRPVRFRSRASAIKELRDYLCDLQRDIDAGRIGPYDRSEFRIAEAVRL
jgi:hypothetical protein